jgi:Protein of unknown function (DUF642)/PEP-CTERM motif
MHHHDAKKHRHEPSASRMKCIDVSNIVRSYRIRQREDMASALDAGDAPDGVFPGKSLPFHGPRGSAVENGSVFPHHSERYMKVRIRPIGLALAMLILAAGQAKASDLIINGDFSAPDAATLPNNGSVYKFIYAGDPSLTGWTVTNGSVETDVTVPTFGAPTASGNPQNLDLDGNSAGTIAQSFATIVGQTYSLAFYYSNNVYAPVSGAAATISVTGSSLTPFVITHMGATYGSLDWQYAQQTFVGTSASATLTFASNDPPSDTTGILLDNVSVAGVPEPSSIILLALGGGGLVAFARRWRSRRTS